MLIRVYHNIDTKVARSAVYVMMGHGEFGLQ